MSSPLQPSPPTVRGDVARWLVVTGLAAVLGVGTWSARILFLPEDPYVKAERQRIQADLRDIQEVLAQQRQALEAAKRQSDANRDFLQAAKDSLEGDRHLLDAIGIVFHGVAARSDSVQAKQDDAFLATSPPRPGSVLWTRSKGASRFLRRIDWDSAEVASIGTSLRGDLAPRIGPLLTLLSAEKRKWQAVARWAGANDVGHARWDNVVHAEHAFRTAFHGAAIVLVDYRTSSGILEFDPKLKIDSDSTISERLIDVIDSMSHLERVASLRQTLALLGVLISALLLFYTLRYALTGQLPKWWHSLRWVFHLKSTRLPKS